MEHTCDAWSARTERATRVLASAVASLSRGARETRPRRALTTRSARAVAREVYTPLDARATNDVRSKSLKDVTMF